LWKKKKKEVEAGVQEERFSTSNSLGFVVKVW